MATPMPESEQETAAGVVSQPSGSPRSTACPGRLDPPQPSRTPELTSRSLHRNPDGFVHASDVFKSDERFQLETDDDDDWRRSLCPEPTACGKWRQSDPSKKLMQGGNNTLDWQESAESDMESGKDRRNETEREISFSWTMSDKTSERAECGEQLLNQTGERPQENLWKDDFESTERKRIDDTALDHEAYVSVKDRTEDDRGGKHQDPPRGSSIQIGGVRETKAAIAPKQGQDMRTFVTSIAPVEVVVGSKEYPDQLSGRKTKVTLNSEKSIDPFLRSSLFGDEALHKLLGKSTKISYWTEPANNDRQNMEAGELMRSKHISGSRESHSVDISPKELDTHLDETVTIGDKKIFGRETTLVLPKDPLDAVSFKNISLRKDVKGVSLSSEQSSETGKTQASDVTDSALFSKDDNAKSLLVQSFSSEREELNTATVENLCSQKRASEFIQIVTKKDPKVSSAALTPLQQENHVDVVPNSRSKIDFISAPICRVLGSTTEGIHPPHPNPKTRKPELRTSSRQSLPMKSNLNISTTGTKKASSMQNLKSQGNISLERLIDDNESTNQRKNITISNESPSGPCGKGKSNEELEDRYLELIGNVANLRQNAVDRSVPSASTFEKLQSPAPSKILELHEHLNDLNKQIVEERQQKQLILQRFSEQHHEFERISNDKQDLWEGKLRELQKDKYALQIRLQEIEAEDPKQKIKRAGESVNLTEGELRRLRQEILEQEALIKGYQVENEKAVKRLKDIESTYKERALLMAEENARLASQLANIQFAGCQTTIYGSTPNASKEIHALRTELHEMQNRESMLNLELERERKANQELGKSLASLNQDSEKEVGSLKQMLVKERKEHTQAVELKEEQTQSYLQSQDAVKTLTIRLEDQAGIIADLRSKIELLGSQEESGKENERDSRKSFQGQKTWSNIQKVKAMKRIDELEKQVKKMEANVKLKDDRVEDNQKLLASRIEDSEKVKSLQDEVMALRQQTRDDNSKNILQGLRQEHDQLKQEYSRVCALNQQLKNQVRASAENDPSSVKKVKDLEKQVEDIRAFYIKKVRDLTKQLADSRKENSKTQTNLEARKVAEKFNFKMNKLEETLASRDAVIKKLQLKIKDLEARKGNITRGSGLGPYMTKSTSPPLLANSNSQQTNSKADVIMTDNGEKPKECLPSDRRDSSCNKFDDVITGVDLAEERKLLKPVLLRRNSKNVKEAGRPVAGGEPTVDTSAEVASLRKQLEAAEIAREVLQRTCTETMERAALISVQHQQMMMSLQEAHALRVAETQNIGKLHEVGRQRKCKSHASELADENEMSGARVKDVSVELHDYTGQKSPRMAQLRFLRKKIEDMEARHKARELEWQRLMHDIKRVPRSKGQDKDDLIWQKAFAAKNEEMESFKSEVDLVLEAALTFQRSQMESDNKKYVKD